MEMNFEVLPTGTMLVTLTGKLDLKAALEIDQPFMEQVTSHTAVIVDMTAVDFLASMGLRTLVLAAKRIHAKLGRLVLLNPREDVLAVLIASGVDTLLPVFQDRAAAEERVKGL